jgi:hypothetical protein
LVIAAKNSPSRNVINPKEIFVIACRLLRCATMGDAGASSGSGSDGFPNYAVSCVLGSSCAA